MSANPIIAEVTRGEGIESWHRGSYVVSDSKGKIVTAAGAHQRPQFPRSAIKAFQCLPLIEHGAADRFGLADEEIALCCASHGGEEVHTSTARNIFRRTGLSEDCLECGAHLPFSQLATFELVRQGLQPSAIHNNCSGKHAGMLAFAEHMGFGRERYVRIDHPVQQAIAKTLSDYCELDISRAAVGTDGCSVPTWAIAFDKVAMAFAKLADAKNSAGYRIIQAVRKYPQMIAATGSFDVRLMQAVPRVFIKLGAEGVYCGCIPHAGLGFALKCDDGSPRGAEVAIACVLAKLQVWTPEEAKLLQQFSKAPFRNCRDFNIGEIRAREITIWRPSVCLVG